MGAGPCRYIPNTYSSHTRKAEAVIATDYCPWQLPWCWWGDDVLVVQIPEFQPNRILFFPQGFRYFLTILANWLYWRTCWQVRYFGRSKKFQRMNTFHPSSSKGPHSLPYWVTKNAAVTIMGCFLGQVKYGEGRPLITSHVMRNTMELSWLGRTHFLPYVWLSETTWGLVIVTMVTLIQHDGQHFTGVLC